MSNDNPITDERPMMPYYSVYREGEWPKPKKYFFNGMFATRQKARNFCRNRSLEPGLTIVFPGGEEETYQSEAYQS